MTTEEFIIYGILVAGKSANFAEQKLAAFEGKSPFAKIRQLLQQKKLSEWLRKNKMGCYAKLEKSFAQVIHLDLNHLTIEKLEAIHGIGKKTSRFIMTYTQGKQEVVLDTHVLKFLRAKGYDAPKVTPTSKKKYDELTRAFKIEARKRGMTPAELDQEIWTSYAI